MLDDIKRLPKERRVTVLSEMFGPEDGEKLARLADHLDVVRRNIALVDDQSARAGAVDRLSRSSTTPRAPRSKKPRTPSAPFRSSSARASRPPSVRRPTSRPVSSAAWSTMRNVPRRPLRSSTRSPRASP
jgi:hypothetical protein